jgi:hypothetical protein
MGANPLREDGAFDDSFQGTRRLGCRLTSRQPGGVGSTDSASSVQDAFIRAGWAQDLRYSADGPDGSDIGMRRRDILCLLVTRSSGHDDTDTTSRTVTVVDDTVLTIAECARDVASNEGAGVPDSVWRIATAHGVDSLYAIDERLQYPPYQDGDFDGDGIADAAVLVSERTTGKLGVAFVLVGSRRVIVVGAGKAAKRGADDLAWIDQWDVYRRQATTHLTIRLRPSLPLRADALWISKRDSADAFLVWSGAGFSWDDGK